MPYENEHSCRLQDPKNYKRFARKTCDQKHKGKCIDVIYGIKEVKADAEAEILHALPWLSERIYNTDDCVFVEGKVFQATKWSRGTKPPNDDCWKLVSEIQALRFKTDIWTAADARAVCKARKGTFEPAKPKKKQARQSANIAPQSACSFDEDCRICFVEDEKKNYDLEIIGYSGKIMYNHWYWGNVAFDLGGIKWDKPKMPILEEHCRATHLAFSKKQEITDAVRLYCQFLTNNRAQEIKRDMQEGFPMQASLHIIPLTIEYVKEGATVKVNGQILTGPGAVFRQSRIREVSLCTLGLDRNTKAAIAAKENEEKVSFNVLTTEKETDIMEMTEITKEQLAEERPDLTAELIASGEEKGQKDLRELFNQFVEKFGDDPAFCIEQFKAGNSLDVAIAAQNEKLKKHNTELAEKAKAKAGSQIDPAKQEFTDTQVETAGGDGSDLKGEAKWKDEFAKSKELQDQFKTEAAYIAFQKHDAAGEVHIAGRVKG